MTDEKKPSKWPSFAEVSKMATKLFEDIKHSCSEIYQNYKNQHPDTENPTTTKNQSTENSKKNKKNTPDSESKL